MTARESADAKAARYLREGRLLVTRVDGDSVEAECRGSGEVYALGHDPARPGGWWCSCPAPRGCCHLVALESVTVRRRPA
jgi:uncharacterized Zn finger protein